jgi:transposase-like protein
LIDEAKRMLAHARVAALAGLQDAGWTMRELARQLGVNRSKVADARTAWRRARGCRGHRRGRGGRGEPMVVLALSRRHVSFNDR